MANNNEDVEKYRKLMELADNSYSQEDDLDLHHSATSFGSHNRVKPKSLKDKSPNSADPDMRIQTWVGGFAPHGFAKDRRSYKPKKKEDEIYFQHHD